MLRFVIAIFFVLHGLVHLLYMGQSSRLFELQPGMLWPDGSWAFSGLVGDPATRLLASIGCVLAAVAFVAGGAALALRQAWWRPLVVGAAALSAIAFVVFWDGQMQQLSERGLIGILINVAILGAVLVLKWPEFKF